MTLTTASLHILLPQGDPDPRDALTRAYRTLGFSPSHSDEIAPREAVLARGDEFISIYDSACAQEDDGTLRALATSLSATLQTCAVVTTVQASEDFAFLLFDRGELVDSAVSDPDCQAADLRAVRGPRQAEIWRAALGEAHFAGMPHRAGDDPADPIARFVAIAQAASRSTDREAEDRLAAWCRLAQLPARAALRGFIDAASSPSNRRLKLSRCQSSAGPPHATLAAHRCDDEYPYHLVYPAAWPAEACAEASFVWPILSRNQGLGNPRISLHIEQENGQISGFLPLHVSLCAHTSQHGKMLSPLPVASFGLAVDAAIAQREPHLLFDADPFGPADLPPPQPAEFLLLLRLDVRAPAAGEALITPAFRTRPEAAPLILPTLRLAARQPAWQPIVADPLDEAPSRRQATLRLNSPACLTMVAILGDDSQDTRSLCRTAVENWLLPMTESDLNASIRVQRHPASLAGGHPIAHSEPLASLLQGPFWQKLFSPLRDLQSAQIEICRPGSGHALAGASLQTSLRPADGAAASGEAATMALAFWAIADETVLAGLRVDMVAARAAFAEWVRAAAPLQAWMADCAWIPSFDTYQSCGMTLYEAAAAVDWVGSERVGTLCDPAWPRRRLRFVARHLWLGWELAARVDTARLVDIAEVTDYADCVEIELRRPADLPALERRLVPILPMQL